MLYLQNRWKVVKNKLIYYGMRKKPYLLKNTVKLTKKEKDIICKLPKELNNQERKIVKRLINQEIIVEENKLRKTHV